MNLATRKLTGVRATTIRVIRTLLLNMKISVTRIVITPENS